MLTRWVQPQSYLGMISHKILLIILSSRLWLGTQRDVIVTAHLSQPLLLSDKMPFSDNSRRRELTTLESMQTCIVISFIGIGALLESKSWSVVVVAERPV